MPGASINITFLEISGDDNNLLMSMSNCIEYPTITIADAASKSLTINSNHGFPTKVSHE